MTVRIGAVHALMGSIEPIESAFQRIWPDAEVVHLCDQSLYLDYQRWRNETDDITRRIARLLEYSAETGAQGILFSGSLFTRSVEEARAQLDIPVLYAYEAMIEAAFAAGNRLALLATVEDSIAAIERDANRFANDHGLSLTLDARHVEGAMNALQSGDRPRHDKLIASTADELGECDALMLAQHSMGSARHQLGERPGRKILTSPDTATTKLKQLVLAR